MGPRRTFGPLLVAAALFAYAAGAWTQARAQTSALASAPTQPLADGRNWQDSSIEQRRAYLVGISNAISVGARYDSKHASAGADTFALRAQRGLEGARMEPTISAVDAWYKAHPHELSTPVLSVIWLAVAKQLSGQGGGAR
jgi:hypothetical protein